jgi:hypothetical protein
MSSKFLTGAFSAGDWSVEDAFEHTKVAVLDAGKWSKSRARLLWTKTTRRLRAAGGFIIFT